MTRRFVWLFIVTAMLVAASVAGAQSRFKNIQVLKGLSDAEINKTMQLWSRQLGVKCVDCHVQGDFASDEKQEKKVARQMYQILTLINEQSYFKSASRKVDCFLCHKGSMHIPTAETAGR